MSHKKRSQTSVEWGDGLQLRLTNVCRKVHRCCTLMDKSPVDMRNTSNVLLKWAEYIWEVSCVKRLDTLKYYLLTNIFICFIALFLFMVEISRKLSFFFFLMFEYPCHCCLSLTVNETTNCDLTLAVAGSKVTKSANVWWRYYLVCTSVISDLLRRLTSSLSVLSLADSSSWRVTLVSFQAS